MRSLVYQLAILWTTVLVSTSAYSQQVIDLGTNVTAVTNNKDFVVSYSADAGGTIRLFRATTLEEIATFDVPAGQSIVDLEIDKDQEQLVVLTAQGQLIRWPLGPGDVQKTVALAGASQELAVGAICAKGQRVIASSGSNVYVWNGESGEQLKAFDNAANTDGMSVAGSFTTEVTLFIFGDVAVFYDVLTPKEVSRSVELSGLNHRAGKRSLTGRYYALPATEKVCLFDFLHQQSDYVECKSDEGNVINFSFVVNDKYLLVQNGEEKRYSIDVWRMGEKLDAITYNKPIDGCLGGPIFGLPTKRAFFMHGISKQDDDIKGIQFRAIGDETPQRPFGQYALRTPQGDALSVSSMVAADNASLVAAATSDSKLHLWSMDMHLVRLMLENDQSRPYDRMTTGSLHGSVKLPASAKSLSFVGVDRGLLIACGNDHSYLLGIDENFQKVKSIGFDYGTRFAGDFQHSFSKIEKISFSPNGDQLLVATSDALSVLDLSSEAEIRRLQRSIVAGTYCSNGRQAFIIGSSGAGFLDIQTGTYSAIPNFAAPSSDLTGNLISGLSINDQLAVVDADSGSLVSLLSPTSVRRGGVFDLSDDNSLLATAGRMNDSNKLGVEVIDLRTGNSVAAIEVANEGLYGAYFLPDSSKIAVVGANATRIYNYRRNRLVSEFPKKAKEPESEPEPTPITGFAANSWLDEVGSRPDGFPVMGVQSTAAYDSDSGRLAISFLQRVDVWDIATEQLVWTGALDGDQISEIALSKGGKRLAAGMHNGKVRVIEFNVGK